MEDRENHANKAKDTSVVNSHSEEKNEKSIQTQLQLRIEINLKNLVNELKSVTEWHPLGLQLDVPDYELRRVEQDCSGVNRRVAEVLQYWLNNCSEEKRSWQTIADALKKISQGNLARRVDQYIDESPVIELNPDTNVTRRKKKSSTVVSDDGSREIRKEQPANKANRNTSMWYCVCVVLVVVIGLGTGYALSQDRSTTPPGTAVTENKEDNISFDLSDGIFNERPRMTDLRHLKLPSGEGFDVAASIGLSYEKVGVLLLNDSSGNEVKIIWTDMKEHVVETNVEILRRWLKGSGKRPVTWRTLIQVLMDIGSTELANDIRKALLSKYSSHK